MLIESERQSCDPGKEEYSFVRLGYGPTQFVRDDGRQLVIEAVPTFVI